MICSIDPGVHGAIAWIEDGALFDVVDMPMADKAVSAAGVAHELRKFYDPRVLTVVIEDVFSMPRDGVASAFKFGVGKGILLGVVAALGCETMLYRPSVWKKGMGLTADKELSRRRAIELWPDSYEKFCLKKHDGRAEAALLGRWYYDKYERNTLDSSAVEEEDVLVMYDDSEEGLL